MIKSIIKRNGKKQDFNANKIEIAIQKALMATNKEITKKESEHKSKILANNALLILEDLNKDTLCIEEVQNAVENALMNSGLNDVAKNYIRYRYQREILRSDTLSSKAVEKMVLTYTGGDDMAVKENSNMAFSLQGLNNFLVSEFSKNFWLNHIFTPDQKKAHENGDIHIHDLGLLSVYCCGWDLEQILIKGFTGVKTKIQSKPPKHFRSALGQIVNFIYTLQGEAAGAQALSSFDTYLAPFIRYDNLTYKEVKQAMQEFIFNMAVPTRVGFQTPFFNITLDLEVSSLFKDKHIIIGGEYKEETYGEFQEEMDMLNKAFCEVMTEGDASGRVFTFPIPTYNISKNFNWERPIVDDVMKMTSKYGIPYFANFVNSDMNPEDARSMCCRLRIDNRVLRKRGGGLFGANPMTGSIGVTTINLPRLGYLYKDKTELKKQLRLLMDMCRDILSTKRKFLEKNTEGGLYPYSKFYLADIKERFGEYWKNHFNTIGIVGMNECIRNFTDDKEDITTRYGQEFAKDILDYMNEVLTEYQVNGDLYNLEATPAEGTAPRLAKIDKKTYKDIITAGDKEACYTNSTQLPVNATDDLFEAIELQDELQCKYTGGTVLHAFLGERIHDPNVTKTLLQNIFNNYKLPYLSFTPTFSVCKEHGYLDGEQFTCPHCGGDCEVWTRVVGFYRPVQNFNNSKREEFHQRKEYVVE
ncbi:MAG: ribonucleoside triphosphate reductase [Bacilli bacterium]|nr:ribonucleoside triphosphate reductase [Bacilli bacterium]